MLSVYFTLLVVSSAVVDNQQSSRIETDIEAQSLEEYPTNSEIVDFMEEMAIEAIKELPELSSEVRSIEWDRIAEEMRDGINEGIEENVERLEAIQAMDNEAKPEAVEGYRFEVIQKFKQRLLSSNGNAFTLVYALASAASGLALSINVTAQLELATRFDASSTNGYATPLGSLLAGSFAFTVQAAVMATYISFSNSKALPKLGPVPKELLFGGVFLAIGVLGSVFAVPSLGSEFAGIIDIIMGIATGMLLDRTGLCSLADKKKITSSQIVGGLLAVGGTLSGSLGKDSFPEGSLLSKLTFLPFAMAAGSSATIYSSVSSSLVPHLENKSMHAGVLGYFVAAVTCVLLSAAVMTVERPVLRLEETEWWMWTGVLTGCYSLWAAVALPSKVGVTNFMILRNAMLTFGFLLLDTTGLTSPPVPMTVERVLGGLLCLVGAVATQLQKSEVLQHSRYHIEPTVHIEDISHVETPAVVGEADESVPESVVV